MYTCLVVLCLLAPAPQSASLTGRVVDGQSGEPLGKATVVAGGNHEATTDEHGRFTVRDVPAGTIELYVTAVGYGVVRRSIQLNAGANGLGDLPLHHESTAVTEQVTVAAPERAVAAERTLTKAELQALSAVVVGDPLRAAQSLPGVVANTDLRSDFAVRGAGFDRIGIYVDGVLTDRFIHTLSDPGTTDLLTVAVINQDTVSGLTLSSGGFPARLGGSNAAILDLETREGGRVRNGVRVSTGFVTTAAVVDGPIAHGRGSWLVAARTTRTDYLQRFVEDVTRTGGEDDGSQLDFSDVQGRAVYDLSPRQQVGVSIVAGVFSQEASDSDHTANEQDPNAVDRSGSDNALVSGFWRYTPGPRVITSARIFGVGSRYSTKNTSSVLLNDDRRNETGARADVGIAATTRHYVEAGVYLRSRLAEAQTVYFATPATVAPRTIEAYRERRFEQAYYAQDTWSVGGSSAAVTGGARIESSGLTGETLVSPRLAVRVPLGPRWTARATMGRYAQPPAFAELFGFLGNPDLRTPRAIHYGGSLERRLGDRTSVAVEVYDREDRDLVFSVSEPRLENGRPTTASEPFRNALDGYARGFEVTVQRRSANGFQGWVSYARSSTSLYDAAHDLRFPADADQRHTLNAFGSYRLSGTVAATVEWRRGSGTPIPGFLAATNGVLSGLSAERNQVRAPAYSRIDARIAKAFRLGPGKLTLSGEVLNVVNRKNEYPLSSTLVHVVETGQYVAGLRRGFPLLPSIGVAIEF